MICFFLFCFFHQQSEIYEILRVIINTVLEDRKKLCINCMETRKESSKTVIVKAFKPNSEQVVSCL